MTVQASSAAGQRAGALTAKAVRYISPVKSSYSVILGCKSPGLAGISLEEECVARAVHASISQKCNLLIDFTGRAGAGICKGNLLR